MITPLSKLIFVFTALLHYLRQLACQSTTVLVSTTSGAVRGQRAADVDSFLGIPYAEPPIGHLRFRPPKPRRPWYPQVYAALNFSAECLQSELFSLADVRSRPRREDCLYLNIWTPKGARDASTPYPVLVWIYGGAFVHGGASKPEYVGDQLAAKGVVLVSFNYRIGALGFLVSINDGLYGNYGLDDQRMALQWVQDNIRSFGGDPQRVTLFGESAGAMSIGLHLLDLQYQVERRRARGGAVVSPMRLFHAVILQSNPFGYKYRSVAVANFIGSAFKEQLDCEDLKCLQSESSDELIHVQDTLMAVPRSIGDFFTWGPVVTDQSYYREARLRPGPISNTTVRQPMEAIRSLAKLDIPIIMGTTSHEGTLFVFTAYPTRMAKLIYQTLIFSLFRTSALKVLRMYRSYAKKVSQMIQPDYRWVLSQIIGDYLFRCPNQLVARHFTDVEIAVYLYEFALPTRIPGYACCDGLSCHTCELPFVFHQLDVIQREYSWQKEKRKIGSGSSEGGKSQGSAGTTLPRQVGDYLLDALMMQRKQLHVFFHDQQQRRADEQVANLISSYWVTFARYGDPNGLFTANGYHSSTADASAPWWPRLYGDLPSVQTMEEMRQQAMLRRRYYVNGDKEDGGMAEEVGQDQTNAWYGPNAAGNTEAEGTDAMDSGHLVMEGWTYAHHHDRSLDEFPTDAVDMLPTEAWLTTGVRLDADQPRTTGVRLMASPANIRYMHQMIFDEHSATAIIENDCVCNFWNSLEYRF